MEIIDSHVHIGDIYRGFPVKYPLLKIPFGLVSILELIKYNRPFFLKGSNNRGNRLLGDIAYMESCKRIQVCEPEIYFKYFKKNGVSKAILLPIEPNVKTSYVLELSKQHKNFIPFASVDFYKNNFISRLTSYIEQGCYGLKIHPVIQQIHPEDERIYAILEEMARYNLPVCFHSGPARAGVVKIEDEEYAHPLNLLKVVKKFPFINFIFAHIGLGYSDIVIEMAAEYKNIYFDTSFQPAATILKAIKRVGYRKILFGSDFPVARQEVTLSILKRNIKDKGVLKRILAENIKELIGFRE